MKLSDGQWIVWQNQCYKVNFLNGRGYELILQNGLITSIEYGAVDKSAHLWTIEDAKDGDVLADKYNNIGIFQEIEGLCWHSYIYLGCNGELQGFLQGFSIGGSHEQTNAHPATKEQRDLLFQKMKEAGYEFDFEKKELKKIE